MRHRIDEQSAVARTASGSDTMRLSCVGAENVFVTSCSFTAFSHASGSKRRSTTIGEPAEWFSDTNASGPEWYIGPVVMCTSLPIWKPSSPSSANTIWVLVPVRSAPFGLPVVPDV